uniref:Uncharacterized protein n=1 Tax=Odontella aurita TaxID=265563 RepID=A0A7S4JA12_9STRA|mmetsp:Transcript_42306/g.128330  ORF Transcript_42306/g.128330 Transcript_42306/m.128330 type:complete len:278 (+) Transcript_42306:288-1121(+)|eukprot:CAMPEP_0113559052 /NCGR_PEP_ID=MMETSP0015_2-20120614/18685_1 /TAXON_ID=2838 /ORGANISM="Odontella" /LENGTH=277 /DNA_ID=CAMNT_0000460651 /DNA_START=177 /DNA_END=1010 /DNA_ORIENTATION=- /assembly_acc=CAM_ASM_000160
MAGTESICGSVIKSKRGALAMGWSIVVILTFIALLTALIFSIQNNYYAANYADENYADENYDEDENEGNDKNKNKNGMVRAVDIVVSSRAMAFAAVWTAILAGIMAVYGTVVLGVQSLSGKYYWCCSKDVHNTTPLSIGMFIGSLLMFANVTLVCSVLFSEFQVRDFNVYGKQYEYEDESEKSVERSSMAFSVTCMFLTILYAGFAGLVFAFSDTLMEENIADERNEKLSPSDPEAPLGYIGGDRFDVIHSNPRKGDASVFIQPDQSRESDESVVCT